MTETQSFLFEVADYWTGMSLEETHEKDDVEAADEDDDPGPPPPPHARRRDSVGGLSGALTSGNCWSWKREISTEALQSVCG
jgi:hypothetical protein